MIVTIRGILRHKMPDEIIVEVSGIGYSCYISNNTYDNLPNLNKEVSLLTYHQISENNQSLYAFSQKNEKEGDKATPRGIFSLGKLYYRVDRINKIDNIAFIVF